MKSAQPGKRQGKRSTVLSSPAWLLRGISSIPGELALTDSRICFMAREAGSAWDWQLEKLERASGSVEFVKSLKAGRRAVVFDALLTDVLIRSPWYYFSGGLVLEIRGESYRISFGRPARSSNHDDDLENLSTMRRVGKRWRHALSLE